MFNLAIDSKLRGCDRVSLRVRDLTRGTQVLSGAPCDRDPDENPATSAVRAD